MQKSNFTKFMESKKLDCMSPLDLKLLTYIVRSIQKKVDWGEGSIKRHIDPLLKQQVSQKNKALYQIFYCALRDWQMADVNEIDDIYKKYYLCLKTTIQNNVKVTIPASLLELKQFVNRYLANCLWTLGIDNMRSLFIKPACKRVISELFGKYDESDQKSIYKILMTRFKSYDENCSEFLTRVDKDFENLYISINQ